jgi:predicted O-methyltransferase YrrM
MSVHGTEAHLGVLDLPPLVERAVRAARQAGFGLSCLPSHGRLLQMLAGGIDQGVIGETGTGCGVGLAWLASGARPGVRLISIDHNPQFVQVARSVFADVPSVLVLAGDYAELRRAGPFSLLALDGGGQGKGGEPPIDPLEWLSPGGVVVLDDFTPASGWPPTHEGKPDMARLHWLEHPHLLATEVCTEPGAATIVAKCKGNDAKIRPTKQPAAR